jgi:squalene-hopene/tetraprenyl-beta-curcumene cyclase
VTDTHHIDDISPVRRSLERAIAALLSLQKSDGHWCGELQGDSILESEYLLMKFILGQQRLPMRDGRDGWSTLQKIAAYLRSQQRDDGGWGQYPGSAIDLSATVKAYFALKLMGDPWNASHMQAARKVIVAHGGAERCNSFSNFYLACLGQISWNAVPAIPPEIVFLPRASYFHLTKVSAWTRTMILPLSIVATLRPTRRVAEEQGIDELFVDGHARDRLKMTNPAPQAWRAFFLAVDKSLKLAHAAGLMPLRRVALARATAWILARAGQDGAAATAGLGAIFPPMVYIQIALQALGFTREDAVVQRAERELEEFFIEQDGMIRIQPCFSPVWDTGIALYALTDCGLEVSSPAVRRACDWLLEKECRHVGDWIDNIDPSWRNRILSPSRSEPTRSSGGGAAAGRSESPPSAQKNGQTGFGWYFEYHNAWYPDCDDTAMVAMALRRAGRRTSSEASNAAQRGVQWLLAMQNDDGGWAAFDRTRHRQILEYIPFADHNAMQDPSCPDITGRVLECLSWHGFTNDDHAVRRAIRYIRSKQEPEGCWFGRWGVNYIYGTWQAVIGPIRCGESPYQAWIQKAGRWIKSIQKQDGSFGESANSYDDPALKGQGPSTASQTAWAAMILQEIFGPHDASLRRAIEWLSSTQLTEVDALDRRRNPDGDPAGSWVEPWFTGTGFPRVFYLRYHLYRLYFPVMALGRFIAAHQSHRPDAAREEHRVEMPIVVGVRDPIGAMSSVHRDPA